MSIEVPERMKNNTTWQGQVLDVIIGNIDILSERDSLTVKMAVEMTERIEEIVNHLLPNHGGKK